MTCPNHVIQSYLLTSLITSDYRLLAVATLLGGLPDLVHLLDKKGDWTIYNKFHAHKWWKWLIPFYNLHLLEDWFTHEPEGGWKSWAYYVEVVTDFIMAFILFLIIKGTL